MFCGGPRALNKYIFISRPGLLKLHSRGHDSEKFENHWLALCRLLCSFEIYINLSVLTDVIGLNSWNLCGCNNCVVFLGTLDIVFGEVDR